MYMYKLKLRLPFYHPMHVRYLNYSTSMDLLPEHQVNREKTTLR